MEPIFWMNYLIFGDFPVRYVKLPEGNGVEWWSISTDNHGEATLASGKLTVYLVSYWKMAIENG